MKPPYRGLATVFIMGTLALAWQPSWTSAAVPSDGMQALQCVLNALGYHAGPMTGTMTPETVAAWSRFLQAHGMSPQTEVQVSKQALLREYMARVPASVRDCPIPIEGPRLVGQATEIAPPDSLVLERVSRVKGVYRLAYSAAQHSRMPPNVWRLITQRWS